MRTVSSARRTALKLLLAGSATSLVSACGALNRLPRGGSLGSTDGSLLAIEVRDALRGHASTSQFSLDISSKADEVVIKGFVGSAFEIDNIEIVANQVSGVRHVIMDVYVR